MEIVVSKILCLWLPAKMHTQRLGAEPYVLGI